MSGFVWAAWGHWVECNYPGTRLLAADGGSIFRWIRRVIEAHAGIFER